MNLVLLLSISLLHMLWQEWVVICKFEFGAEVGLVPVLEYLISCKSRHVLREFCERVFYFPNVVNTYVVNLSENDFLLSDFNILVKILRFAELLYHLVIL